MFKYFSISPVVVVRVTVSASLPQMIELISRGNKLSYIEILTDYRTL